MQWVFAAVFLSLPCLLTGAYLLKHLPAHNYPDAMAKGQYHRASDFLTVDEQNNPPPAINALANQYYLGLGVAQNYDLAAQLYHAAASQGYAAAQLNLGHLYSQGLGVSKSEERAYGWYTQADSNGSEWAEYYIAQISSESRLTSMQMSKAKERWRKLQDLAAEPL